MTWLRNHNVQDLLAEIGQPQAAAAGQPQAAAAGQPQVAEAVPAASSVAETSQPQAAEAAPAASSVAEPMEGEEPSAGQPQAAEAAPAACSVAEPLPHVGDADSMFPVIPVVLASSSDDCDDAATKLSLHAARWVIFVYHHPLPPDSTVISHAPPTSQCFTRQVQVPFHYPCPQNTIQQT